MRMNFYELLANREFDLEKEYETLWVLFVEEESILSRGIRYPLIEYIDSHYFRQLPFRGSFCSLKDLMTALGIEKYPQISIDILLLFSELLLAVLPDTDTNLPVGYEKQKKVIIGNIDYILEQTNHEIIMDENKRKIIVEKNQLTTLAAEVVSDKSIAFDMIEYNHFALKGHLNEKRKLLASIANFIEPILKSNALQKGGYKVLQSDAGFVFNNFHIRHNNKDGAKKQDYVASLSDYDLEEWYDRAYVIAMTVIIVNDYLSMSTEIVELKKNYTWRS